MDNDTFGGGLFSAVDFECENGRRSRVQGRLYPVVHKRDATKSGLTSDAIKGVLVEVNGVKFFRKDEISGSILLMFLKDVISFAANEYNKQNRDKKLN